MHPFKYTRATDVTNFAKHSAVAGTSARSAVKATFLAGGTTLVDLLRLNVLTPAEVLDINRLEIAKIEPTADGGLRIGANARNTAVAYDALIIKQYPVLAEAILSGATVQIRNMASVGGNLLQRTRCPYYRDTTVTECNKRDPGSGCAMQMPGAFNRLAAVLGRSDKCAATHPSDMCVALAALDATVVLHGASGGERRVAFNEFFPSWGDKPERETTIQPAEIIIAIELPKLAGGAKQTYLKIRDRASYEFALASVAAVVWTSGGKITRSAIALGGVGTKPWRSKEAEAALQGKEVSEANFRAAAEAALKDAKTLEHNAFKPELCRRAIVKALMTVTA